MFRALLNKFALSKKFRFLPKTYRICQNNCVALRSLVGINTKYLLSPIIASLLLQGDSELYNPPHWEYNVFFIKVLFILYLWIVNRITITE